MNKTLNLSPKKAPKRVTYAMLGCVEVNKIKQPIQIRNISKTGIQFFSSVHIPNNVPIHLMWQDPKVGHMESDVMVVRSIQEVEDKFPYCYGSRFVNLENEARKNMDFLVETTEELERKSDLNLLSGVTFESINDVMINGRAFLRDIFKGTKSFAVIDKFARELKMYEREAFGKTDEVGQWIQKLVTQYFHSRVLLVVLERPMRLAIVIKLVKEKIQSIEILIRECQKFLELSTLAQDPDIIAGVQESLNRLIYARVELMEIFTKRTGIKLEAPPTKPEPDKGPNWDPGRAGRIS